MASSSFSITKHVVPGQHIREYSRATVGEQEDILYLEVKQYVPLSNTSPSPGDVTIIAAHANGFPKELYEPFFEDVLSKSQSHGFKIRGIWIADVATQGQSGVLNEKTMGNDPSWFDHPRDLLHIINTFRSEMPRPLIGIGHSMGGCQIATLSLIHARLLSAIILIDPVIYANDRGDATVRASTFRQDLWKSKEAAEKGFLRSKFYQAWDKRVFQRWMQFGIRQLPTEIYPNASGDEVTLSTTKHQEVFSFSRPNFQGKNADGEIVVNRETHPDVDSSDDEHYPFYRPEPPIITDMLPRLRPKVLFLFGSSSNICNPSVREVLMKYTGIGIGGNGGVKEGAVSEHTFERNGHLVPMENPVDCASVAAAWLGKELKTWAENEAKFREAWSKTPVKEKSMISDEWKKMIGAPPVRPQKTKL